MVEGDVKTVQVSGRITQFSSQALYDHVMELARGGGLRAIVIDMNQVQFADSHSIGQLILLKEEVEKLGLACDVDAKAGPIAKILELCRVRVFDGAGGPGAGQAANVCVHNGLVVAQTCNTRQRMAFHLSGHATGGAGHALSYIHKCAAGSSAPVTIDVSGITNWSGQLAASFREFVEYCESDGLDVTVTGQGGAGSR